MKKLLLIPAALVLSTGFAFAGDHGGLSLSQSATINQKIGSTSWYSSAENTAKVLQVQVPIGVEGGGKTSLSQKATVNQSIGKTTGGSEAENTAKVIQVQAPFIF